MNKLIHDHRGWMAKTRNGVWSLNKFINSLKSGLSKQFARLNVCSCFSLISWETFENDQKRGALEKFQLYPFKSSLPASSRRQFANCLSKPIRSRVNASSALWGPIKHERSSNEFRESMAPMRRKGWPVNGHCFMGQTRRKETEITRSIALWYSLESSNEKDSPKKLQSLEKDSRALWVC